MQTRAKRPGRPETGQARIVTAAIHCFETTGSAKITMEDIAEAAGVDRKTVYRTFGDRAALLDAIAIRRVRENVARVKPFVDSCSSLEQAIVEGSILSVRMMRLDRVFMAVVEDTNSRGVEQYLIDPTSPVLEPMLSVWQEAFAQARARGELRGDLTDAEISNWLRGVHLLLLLQEDLSRDGQAELLKKFVLPALSISAQPNGPD